MSDDHDKHGEGHSGGGSHGGGGHGGGHSEGEHEAGAPEWLISFADNVALLMGFFVILLAMNMGPKGTPVQGGAPSEVENNDPAGAAAADRQLDFVIGVRSAFNNPVNEKNPGDAALIKRMKEREERGETRTPGPAGKKKDNSSISTSDYVNINALALFAENTDEMVESAEKALEDAAEHIRGTQWVVELRGHVSASEAKRDKERAMRLAYERSAAVAKVLVQHGVRWEQLRLVSCADNQRAVPLALTKSQQADNQRVEVVVTQETLPTDPYAQPASGAASAPSSDH